MKRVRRALVVTTSLWLSSQIVALILTPTVSWPSVTKVAATECTCTHGANAACPMHHKPSSGSNGSKFCPMQNAGEATTPLMSLLNVTGLLPVSSPIAATMLSTSIAIADYRILIVRRLPPDPPPPRA